MLKAVSRSGRVVTYIFQLFDDYFNISQTIIEVWDLPVTLATAGSGGHLSLIVLTG